MAYLLTSAVEKSKPRKGKRFRLFHTLNRVVCEGVSERWLLQQRCEYIWRKSLAGRQNLKCKMENSWYCISMGEAIIRPGLWSEAPKNPGSSCYQEVPLAHMETGWAGSVHMQSRHHGPGQSKLDGRSPISLKRDAFMLYLEDKRNILQCT